VVITGLVILLLVQTLRIGDLKQTERSLRTSADILVGQRERYYTEKHDEMAKVRTFRSLYDDAREEITRLSSRILVLESELRDEEVSSGQLLEDKAKVIQELQDRLAILRKTRECVSAGHLQSGLTYLMRFVAANQWMMENNKSLAEAVASVSEVAEAITERED